MRWIYLDPSNPLEAAYRRDSLAKIDAWWNAFKHKVDDLNALFTGKSKWDVVAWMAEHLQAVHPELMWEYGAAIRVQGHSLVITPEVNRSLRPMVHTLLDRAPQLEGWEFYRYRQPESVEVASQMVQARTGGDLSGWTCSPGVGEANTIALLFHAPVAGGREPAALQHDGFVAAEGLLGEETLDHWIGTIETQASQRGGFLSGVLGRKATPTGAVPLDKLKSTVDALIASIQEQLPDRPQHRLDLKSDSHRWSGFKLAPEEAEDYPDRADLFVAVTGYPAFSVAATKFPSSFFSGRFSRFNETFCYLKIDGAERLQEPFQDRESIEDALDGELIAASVGCTIGGGTGLRYSYIDLALQDVPQSMEIIRKVLRDGRISKRTWLLFFDAELSDEWVGIYPDTPAPPPRQKQD